MSLNKFVQFKSHSYKMPKRNLNSSDINFQECETPWSLKWQQLTVVTENQVNMYYVKVISCARNNNTGI